MKTVAEKHERFKEKFAEESKSIEEKATETVLAQNTVKNAWESIRNNHEFSDILNNLNEFDKLKEDIKSFSEFDSWMKETGNRIKNNIPIYGNV